jgi:hypothetical protein
MMVRKPGESGLPRACSGQSNPGFAIANIAYSTVSRKTGCRRSDLRWIKARGRTSPYIKIEAVTRSRGLVSLGIAYQREMTCSDRRKHWILPNYVRSSRSVVLAL